MFKSGFYIFLITEKSLIMSKTNSLTTLPSIYKNLVINNKFNLINETYKFFNLNSLKFIMIKLGIIYKEFYLIEKAMKDLTGFDMKTAHLLMQYIVESSSLPYVVDNLNDNFFIYSIRTAIHYMIKLFSSRVEALKSTISFKKSLKNTNFLKYFKKDMNFKELVILSKYLDELRKLDNEIYYQRKITSESLNIKINNLSVKICDKNSDLKDIAYYKNGLYRGKVSDAQNFVITQISPTLPLSNGVHLPVLNKMMVELYCYKILQEEEKYYGLCITILRNVAYNPNLFFKNVAMKTQIRPLRNFLMNHLEHSKFTSDNEANYFKLMKYIDQHYSNPSFSVEYNLKSTKTLLFREFVKISYDLMANKTYKLLSKPQSDYLGLTANTNNNFSRKKSYTGIIFTSSPLLNSSHLRKLNELLHKKKTDSDSFAEVYENFFSNSEIDDFGMNKKNYKTPPIYLNSDYTTILSHLIHNYFSEHDEKLYFMISEKEKERLFDCIECKKILGNSDSQVIDRNTVNLGYSNISYENLKYFDISHIIRIKFDDFLKRKNLTENIVNQFSFEEIEQVKSIFYYITGHFQTNLLDLFIKKLISSQIFKNFLAGEKISTEYFCQKKKEFIFIDTKMRSMFNFDDNIYIKEIIFTNFVKNGILIQNIDKVGISSENLSLIRSLIFNDSIQIRDQLFIRYKSELKASSSVYSNTKDQFEDLVKTYKYEIKRALERLSLVDEIMDEFILTSKNNHYLLSNLLDFNLLDPKAIFYKHQNKLDTWQRMILLSKYDININIFEIALENLSILKHYSSIEMNKLESVLIFLGCLIYHKKSNINLEQSLKNKVSLSLVDILKISEVHIPRLIQSTESDGKVYESMGVLSMCKDSHSSAHYPENFHVNELVTNNIFTTNQDISIKCLINNYYKFLNCANLTEWGNRSNKVSITLDNFEILIENGRVIDAFHYYNCHMKKTYSLKEVETRLYHICLNNLLNYNIFSAVVTLLYLMNGSTKELIVQIEAANRIIIHELNILSRTDKSMTKDEMLKFLKMKNLNLQSDKKYFEVNEEGQRDSCKAIISIYKKLVSEFREFKEINKTSNENIVFQILKRLEDATWDGNKQFLLNTPAKEIALDSPWHLVSLFCRIHNYEMSLTLLHELGRNNNWIAFLYKAQDQDCPPANVLMIIDGYFKDTTLKTHLFITIQSMVDSQDEKKNLENEGQIGNISSGKIDYSKLSFNFFSDFTIYHLKPKMKTGSHALYDPIYFMTSGDFKEKNLKSMNILNESMNINWKDLIFVSLIFNNAELETIFTAFTLYLYMSVKEIIITKNSYEDFTNLKNLKIIKNLKEVFDNKKKSLKLVDLENLIKALLLNNHPQVVLEVLELFDMPFSFDEFVLFTKSLFENNFEDAFIHLFIFKNSIFEFFNSNFSNNFTRKVWEEEGNVNSISNEFIVQEIKTFRQLILVFFYQVSNTIINNLISLYDTKFNNFKLYKLLEVLYLSKWNKRYSSYFKNMCVLNSFKGKNGRNFNYKFPFEKIVELLISENKFSILSEYILSFEENKEDDTLLYNIFSTISNFEKNYILYNDEERIQFWECLDNLLIKANFSNLKIAKFFLFILETKEDKFYIREQFYLIVRIYKYLMENFSLEGENDFTPSTMNFSFLRDMDKFSKFMKTVVGYKINKEIKDNELIEDLKNRIFITVFSHSDFENLKRFFTKSSDFTISYLMENLSSITSCLKEEESGIKFFRSSKTFWRKIQTEEPAGAGVKEKLGSASSPNNPNLDQESGKSRSGGSLNNPNNSDGGCNLNEWVRKACLNLANLSQSNIALELSLFYKISIEELEKFDMFLKFINSNYSDLKQLPYFELNGIYHRACNKLLEPSTSYVKTFSFSTDSKLIFHLNNCLRYKSIEGIVLYEMLKLLISIKIDLDSELFNRFEANRVTILSRLIDIKEDNYKDTLLKDLNQFIDNDDLLASTLIEKFFTDKGSIKLFRYVKYFKSPYKLGYGIKNHIKSQIRNLPDVDTDFLESIFLGYYCFLKDCSHSSLQDFFQIIESKIDESKFFPSVFKLFHICEDEVKVKEIFYCINKIISNKDVDGENSDSSRIDIYGKFKSEIEFYNKSKNFKKLGEIYLKLAYEYTLLTEEKNSLTIHRSDSEIIKKQQELTILNLYIRAAELFLMDNCILNYSRVFNDINKLIKEKFGEDIDINFQ